MKIILSFHENNDMMFLTNKYIGLKESILDLILKFLQG